MCPIILETLVVTAITILIIEGDSLTGPPLLTKWRFQFQNSSVTYGDYVMILEQQRCSTNNSVW